MLLWDATCPNTFAPSHISAAVRGAGVMAAQAEQVKVFKYAHPDTSHHFVPFVIETSGVLGKAAEEFMQELARHIYKATGEPPVPPSETVCCNPKRKCSSSPRKHGGQTGLLGVTCTLAC